MAPDVARIGSDPDLCCCSAFWQFSALYVMDTPTWPPVTRIFQAWIADLLDGSLVANLLATLWRQMLGYWLAVVLGISVGVAMGYYRIAYNLMEPLIEIFRPIPGPAYPADPGAVCRHRRRNESRADSGRFLVPDPAQHLQRRALDRPCSIRHRPHAGTHHRYQTLREIVLPAALPQILTGMRISLAISLILAILSEMIVSNNGLGYFTLSAERTFKVPDMYAGIFTLAMLGYALNRLFLLGEARLIRWHQESSGRR